MDTHLESSHSLFFLIGGAANAGIVGHFEIFSLSQEGMHGGSYVLSAAAKYKSGGVGPFEKEAQSSVGAGCKKAEYFELRLE